MNILVVIHNQTNTGTFDKVLEQCDALCKLGHDVTLLCTSPKARFLTNKKRINGVNIIEFPDLLWKRLRQGIDIWNLINRMFFTAMHNFDIVHGIDCRPVVIFPALFLKKIRKIPLVLSWWDLFGGGATALERSGKFYDCTFGKIETFFEQYFRKYADYSIVVSSLLKHRLISLGIREEYVKILRVGAKKNHFPLINKKTARNALNLPEDEIIYCYAGAIFQSDLELLIKALTIIKIKHKKNPLTILIGQHKIQSDICNELNIMLVERLPGLKDVYLYFNASDYGLLPFNVSISNQARWPSKISDYVAANLPIIATPISDLGEIFLRYNIGFLASSDTAENYSQVLLESFNASNELRKNQIRDCQKLMEKELDWELIASETLKIYETVLNQ